MRWPPVSEIDQGLREALASAPRVSADPELACPETMSQRSIAVRRSEASRRQSPTAVHLREILGELEWARESRRRDLTELLPRAEAAIADSRHAWDVVVLTAPGEAPRAYVFDLASASIVCAGELPSARASATTITRSLRSVVGRPASAIPPVRIEDAGPPPAERPAPTGTLCERYRDCVCAISRSPGAGEGFRGACRDAEDLLRRGVAEDPTCRAGRRMFTNLARGLHLPIPDACR